MTILFWLKVFVSSLVIAGTSHLAGKKPLIAGFIISLPLTSMLALLWAWFEHRDMAKIDAFATSIVVAIPPSFLFFRAVPSQSLAETQLLLDLRHRRHLCGFGLRFLL